MKRLQFLKGKEWQQFEGRFLTPTYLMLTESVKWDESTKRFVEATKEQGGRWRFNAVFECKGEHYHFSGNYRTFKELQALEAEDHLYKQEVLLVRKVERGMSYWSLETPNRILNEAPAKPEMNLAEKIARLGPSDFDEDSIPF